MTISIEDFKRIVPFKTILIDSDGIIYEVHKATDDSFHLFSERIQGHGGRNCKCNNKTNHWWYSKSSLMNYFSILNIGELRESYNFEIEENETI